MSIITQKLFQKMRPLGWALIQYDKCPYKRKSAHRKTHQRCAHRGQESDQPSVSQRERPQEKPTLPTP